MPKAPRSEWRIVARRGDDMYLLVRTRVTKDVAYARLWDRRGGVLTAETYEQAYLKFGYFEPYEGTQDLLKSAEAKSAILL